MKTANSSVKVMADATGNVVVPSKNNPEYGYIRVIQSRVIVDDKGFARKKTLSALIPGLIEDLKAFEWSEGDSVEGKVIFKEQLEPFNFDQPEKDYKIAGSTGIVCCIDGEPIYRKTFYTTNSNAQDVFILDEDGIPVAHTNGDAIRAEYLKMRDDAKSESVDLNDM